jgi:Ca2+-binding EF-hand superfamily protein
MEYWRNKNVTRVVFDQFSEWYNEGGYEIIPWLELLDLNKWVLADQPNTQQIATTQPLHPPAAQMPSTPGPSIYNMDAVPTPAAHTPGMVDTPASFAASPNPEAFKALLASPKYQNGFPAAPDGDPFFDLDMSAVDAEVDEMDFILQNDSAGTDQVAFANNAAGVPSPQKEEQNALKFHLFSNDQHRGYIISIRPNEVSRLHNIVTETGLCHADSSTVCNFILSEAKTSRPKNIRTLSKRAFHAAMSKVCQQTRQSLSTPMPSSTQSELSAFLDKLFISFDQPKTGSVNALEIACGVTVLCGGRKSDKLEHVFELFDEDKDALLSQTDVARFIQSFLVVLMSISSSLSFLDGDACTNDSSTITRAIETGSQWASSQVFLALKPLSGKVCFDDFADWYTKGGYQSIPWLELLDLNKWVLGETT